MFARQNMRGHSMCLRDATNPADIKIKPVYI